MSVARTFLNRVGAPGRPDTVCGVIHQRLQASWTAERPYVDLSIPGERASLIEAFRDAEVALRGAGEDAAPGATHYFAPGKVSPFWADSMVLVADVGRHRFMREPRR